MQKVLADQWFLCFAILRSEIEPNLNSLGVVVDIAHTPDLVASYFDIGSHCYVVVMKLIAVQDAMLRFPDKKFSRELVLSLEYLTRVYTSAHYYVKAKHLIAPSFDGVHSAWNVILCVSSLCYEEGLFDG